VCYVAIFHDLISFQSDLVESMMPQGIDAEKSATKLTTPPSLPKALSVEVDPFQALKERDMLWRCTPGTQMNEREILMNQTLLGYVEEREELIRKDVRLPHNVWSKEALHKRAAEAVQKILPVSKQRLSQLEQKKQKQLLLLEQEAAKKSQQRDLREMIWEKHAAVCVHSTCSTLLI